MQPKCTVLTLGNEHATYKANAITTHHTLSTAHQASHITRQAAAYDNPQNRHDVQAHLKPPAFKAVPFFVFVFGL